MSLTTLGGRRRACFPVSSSGKSALTPRAMLFVFLVAIVTPGGVATMEVGRLEGRRVGPSQNSWARVGSKTLPGSKSSFEGPEGKDRRLLGSDPSEKAPRGALGGGRNHPNGVREQRKRGSMEFFPFRVSGATLKRG